MSTFIKYEEIECLCCKEKIFEPDFSGVYRCGKCNSEMVAGYDAKTQKEQFKYIGAFISIGLVTSASNVVLELELYQLLAVNFVTAIIICSLLRIPLNLNSKPKTIYSYLNGLSYPEQQAKKHHELIEWINNSDSDFIGVVRFISKSDYLVNVIDGKSMTFFKVIKNQTETLPSLKQIKNWQAKYLSEDLKEVENIKEKYHAEFNYHISKLRTLAEGVDFFSD